MRGEFLNRCHVKGANWKEARWGGRIFGERSGERRIFGKRPCDGRIFSERLGEGRIFWKRPCQERIFKIEVR